MPLPPALAARLAKRGLLPQPDKNESATKEAKKKVHEEVIAEDYDNTRDEIGEFDILQKFMGYSGCPNKYNIHHECSGKCKEIWGTGQLQPSEKYMKQQMQLLQKYPLPETWKAIYDPGSGRHYYWDWSSDLVSWLPPSHPRCQISQPASQLREELHLKDGDQDDNVSSEESASDQEMEVDEVETKKDRKAETRERYKSERKSHRDRRGPPPVDPCDPSSYSDIPLGKWSDGLTRQNEAKTGVDPTASGPLFQMRPYPSPGAILRSNRSNNKSETFNKPQVAFPEKPE